MWLLVPLPPSPRVNVQLAAAPAVQPKRASFDISNAFTIKVPEGAKRVRVWFAVPQGDTESEIRALKVEAPYPVRYGTDSYGNRVGYLEVNAPQEKQIAFRETFTLTRTEIRKVADPAATMPLTAERYWQVCRCTRRPSNDETRHGEPIVDGEQNAVLAARKIYDWTLHNIDYWVKDPEHLKASPVGSAEYCLRTKTGNCTDFHSLFSSLTLAVGIPTRIVYGSLLKPTLNGLDVDASYHCWIQFYAPNLDWVTLDVSVADIYMGDFPLTEKNQKLVELTTAVGYRGADPAMVDYYFGNLDERRVVWSIGRDLQLDPPQEDGPVNALHKMYVEVDGKQYTDWTRQFTYREITASNEDVGSNFCFSPLSPLGEGRGPKGV
jgi:transglutaminase-like putative cysteine protease